MIKDDAGRIVFRAGKELKASFVAAVEEHGSDQNKVGVGLLAWWASQDAVVRAVVAGLLPPDQDIIALALRRLARRRRK